VLRTDVISDDLWALIEPVMPSSQRPGRPWNDHRRTLEAIIWRFRTGSPWRDLPEQFGCWQSVAERHLRWSKDQTYTRVFAAVRADLDDQGDHQDHQQGRDLLGLLSVDSTVVRAHQHAAGARPGTRTGG
jgi:putative transposase